MSSQGSPYARFQRALRIGRLPLVRAAAAELPRIDLHDALAICLLIERQDGERYERAVVRWLARLAIEVPSVGIEDLREGLVAFEALPHNPAAARESLAGLCDRHGLARAADRLRRARAGAGGAHAGGAARAGADGADAGGAARAEAGGAARRARGEGGEAPR